MGTITKFLFHPVVSIRRRFGNQRKAFVDDCPPPTIEENLLGYGSYCIKSTVRTTDWEGQPDALFVGYSQNMDIVKKTEVACERYKRSGTKCGEAEMVIKGGECDEYIFMKKKNGDVVTLPPFL